METIDKTAVPDVGIIERDQTLKPDGHIRTYALAVAYFPHLSLRVHL